MSRSGYDDGYDTWAMIRWRGSVASAIRGKRGQKLLRELAEAMDAMPVKRLIANELVQGGEHCALGVVGAARGIVLDGIDPEDTERVAVTFEVSDALVREIVHENDEGATNWHSREETPEERWLRMRTWVAEQLITERGMS
jgi:hypothetical protein